MMKRMLCIDAHSLGLEAVKRAAEGAGYEVLTAANGQQALELFASQEVDGVLLDPRLPDLDAASLGREMERIKPNVPLLFYYGADEGAQTALRCLHAYIQDPAPPDLVLARAARARSA